MVPKIGLALQTVSSIGLETTLKQQPGCVCQCLCANVSPWGRSLPGDTALPVFGCLSCVPVGSGALIKPDCKERFKIFQILPVFTTCGHVFVIPVLQSPVLLSGHRGRALEVCAADANINFGRGWFSPASSPRNVADKGQQGLRSLLLK